MRRETFQTPGPVALKIKIPAGEVHLEASETAETQVEVEPLRGDDDDVRIELRESNSGYEVTVAAERRRLGLRGGDYRVRVRSPQGARVHCQLASADLEGRGQFGNVAVKAASGDIELEQVEDLDVKTASGDVTVRRALGRVAVQSASGDVKIGEAEDGVSAHTASGDVMVESVAQGKVTLRSASGDIEVGIRRGSKLRVDAGSASGDLASELELSDTPTSSEGPLVELRATTASGDVSIKRA